MECNTKQYFDFGKEIIKIINQNGAEAYFVGECVRNIMLKKPVKEIEMFTTANNSQLLEIFREYCVSEYDKDTIRLNYMDCIFYISTFKLTVPKQVRKMVTRHYCTALMDFLERKDFILNSVAMNYSNKIIDPYDARDCIKKKKIKMYGDAKIRFNESPIRIIECLGLVSELGYYMDHNICKGIKSKKKLLQKLSPAVIALKLKDVVTGKYSKRAVKYLVKSNTYKKIPLFSEELKRLSSMKKGESMDEFLINVMVKKGEIDYSVLIAADNEDFVKKTVNLAIANPKGDYDSLTLYRNGLNVCLAANKSNLLWKKAKNKSKKINKAYNNLPIKKTCDLAFKGQDILKITNDNGGKYLEQIINDIEASILLGELVNEYEAIRVFVYRRLYEMKKNNIDSDLKTESNVNQNINIIKVNTDQETKNTAQIDNDYLDEEEYEEEPNNEIEDLLLDEKIQQINLDALEDKLNRQIDDLIKKSNVLDEMKGNEAIDTYNKMKRRYREVLIEKYPEYKKLKDRYHD